MGERSDEIKKHIDTQRSELSENLEQLEQRVKNTTDWRVQFDKRPMVMLGAAFGAGLLVSTLIPMGSRSRKRRSTSYGSYSAASTTGAYTGSSSLPQGYSGSQYSGSQYPTSQGYSGSSEGIMSSERSSKQPSTTRREMRKAWSTLDDIRASLIALGTTRLREYLGSIIPGLDDHYRQTAESRRGSEWGQGSSTDRGQGRSSQTPESQTGSYQGSTTQASYSGEGSTGASTQGTTGTGRTTHGTETGTTTSTSTRSRSGKTHTP